MIDLTADVIEGFVKAFLLKRFDKPTEIPPCHKEWWTLCCLPNRFVAIAAPRGHAKSTAITHSYVLANALFRVRDFIVIVSDTETQAIQFLNDIKLELTENEELIKIFKIDKFLKYTENDIIVQFKDGGKFRILAKGSEQSLRGLKWSGKRPNLIVCDDMENDELVLNQERRSKFHRWIYGALIPCLSPDGIMRVVGTVLHMDSFLERLMPKDNQKTTVITPLKMYSSSKTGMWTAVKYRAHTDDFSHILWPQRFSKEVLQEIRAQYVKDGIPDVYAQEYLNVSLDPARAYFRLADFKDMTKQEKYEIAHKMKPLAYYVGADLAVSERETADYSAFVVIGVDADNYWYFVEMFKDRMDAKELVDTIFNLHLKYNPEFIAIEREKITQAIGPFIRQEMISRQIFPNIIEIPHNSKDLQYRCRSFQGRMRAGACKFDKSLEEYPGFEYELRAFPRSARNDYVAACAVLGQALDKVYTGYTYRELVEEEYEEEYQQYLMNNPEIQGRSKVTGY